MKPKNPASAFLLFVVLSYLGASILIGGIVFALVDSGMSMEGRLPWIIIAGQVFGFLLPLGIWLALTKDSFKRNMPRRPLGWKNILILVLLSFFIQPIANLISSITSLFVTNDIAEIIMALSATPWWLLILAMAVTPGIIEELVFRGYIQTNARGKTFAKIAIMNGFMFALIHMNLHQFAYTFALGVFLAYVVYVTKSIWSGIIIHFIVNATQVSLMVGTIRMQEFLEALAYNPELSPRWYNFFADAGVDLVQLTSETPTDMPVEVIAIAGVTVIAIPAAIISVQLFRWLVKHNRTREEAFVMHVPEPEADELALMKDEEPAGDSGSRFRVDWCLAIVIVIWIVFVVVV